MKRALRWRKCSLKTQSCFQGASVLSLSVSSACPQGTFKSFQGAGLCQQCPLNSRSTIEAATLCSCRNGYYRGDMDQPEDMCTSESHQDTESSHTTTHTHVYHTWVWLYGPSRWLRCTCTFLYITNTSAVDATKRLIFPHWITDQYLLWFIIPTIILCLVFRVCSKDAVLVLGFREQ